MPDFRSIQSKGAAAFAAVERLIADYVRFVNRGDPRPGREPDPEIIRQVSSAMKRQNRTTQAPIQQGQGYTRLDRENRRDTAAMSQIDSAFRQWQRESPENFPPGLPGDFPGLPMVRSAEGAVSQPMFWLKSTRR